MSPADMSDYCSTQDDISQMPVPGQKGCWASEIAFIGAVCHQLCIDMYDQ